VIGNGPVKSAYLCNDFWNIKSDSFGMTSGMKKVLVMTSEMSLSSELIESFHESCNDS